MNLETRVNRLEVEQRKTLDMSLADRISKGRATATARDDRRRKTSPAEFIKELEGEIRLDELRAKKHELKVSRFAKRLAAAIRRMIASKHEQIEKLKAKHHVH